LAVTASVLVAALPLVAAQAATIGHWHLTGSMTSFHGSTALAALQDGRVLAISGQDSQGGLTPVSELYDPATGVWTQTGPVNDPRMAFHNPVVLPDGRVLIAGGHDAQVNDYASAELNDPPTGLLSRTGSLTRRTGTG